MSSVGTGAALGLGSRKVFRDVTNVLLVLVFLMVFVENNTECHQSDPFNMLYSV